MVSERVRFITMSLLFFANAVVETSTATWSGFMEGALESAERVTQEMIS